MLLFKVRRVTSPHMEEFRGYRMVLATPNESGPDGSPSFTGKNLVAQSSDMSTYPDKLTVLYFLRDFARDETITWVK